LDMAANEIMAPTVNANCQYSTRYCCKCAKLYLEVKSNKGRMLDMPIAMRLSVAVVKM